MIVHNEWCLPVRDVLEGCPGCARDVVVRSDGSSSCLHCNHQEIRPCSLCPKLQDYT